MIDAINQERRFDRDNQIFKIVFSAIIGLCFLIGIIGFSYFDFTEAYLASTWTIRYFTLPTFIVMAPLSYFIYLKFLIQGERKKYRLKIWTTLRSIFRITILTIALTAIFYVTTLSTILLSNATGDIKTINLHAVVIDYHISKSRGRIKHYIKIKDDQLNRIVEFKVPHSFEIGQKFNKSMKIGRWGLLYSKD